MDAKKTDRSRQDRWVPGKWVTPVLTGSAAAIWVIRYALRFGLHLADNPQWANYHDQERYIASAQAFAHGDLSATQHWYPLAYSLVAAPFSWIMPNEPFFLPNLALFVVTILLFARVMQRLGFNAAAAIVLFLLGDMVIGKIAKLWMVPWTTSLSAPLIWGLIERTLTIVDLSPDRIPPRPRAMLSLGLLSGALPLIRPTDAVIGILAILFALAMLWRQGRLRASGLGCIILGGLALCIPYGLLHLAIYGPHETEYMCESAVQGFAFADLPWKAYVVVVTAVPWFPSSPSLAEAMPWIIPGAAGLALAFKYGDNRARTALVLIALLAIPYCSIFLAYTDLQPPGLWTFSNAHYFKWLFPLFAVGCWSWLRELRTTRGACRAFAVLIVILSPAAIRPIPVAVTDNVSARMLMFRGATDRFWDSAYFAPAKITDAQGSMGNVGRFHQIPDQYGERAIAVSRLFAGPAVRDDPAEPPPYRARQKPYARYATRVSIGVPCWIRQLAACHLPPPPPPPLQDM